MIADGVYIPKEQNSKDINRFRPISLLNVEEKIFFTVVASRLTKYLLTNGQKGGIPGIAGCLEHGNMIWEAIQKATANKKDLDVIWLDLANAYGLIPNQMIHLSLLCPVPCSCRNIQYTRHLLQWIPHAIHH